MPFYNPMYTRKWTKMFTPVSTFINQLGNDIFFSKYILKKKNFAFFYFLKDKYDFI